MRYPGLKWLTCFAYKKGVRVYAEHELQGFTGLVIDAEPTFVRLVTHNIYRVEVIELLYEDFFKLFIPDFSVTPIQAAKELRGYYRTILTAVPPCATLVERILSSQPTVEEIPVKHTPKSVEACKAARVCIDFNRRTCIELARERDIVTFLPLTEEGFLIESSNVVEFDKRYKPLADYPVDRAAKLYAEYAQHLGATKEAMKCLVTFCPTITEKEIHMATAKKTASAEAKAKTQAAKPAAKKAVKSAKAAKSAPAKKEAPAKKAPTSSAKKEESASGMFQRLIMEGNLTDEQIFKKVQSAFNLDDKKRSYVAWYRNHLTKTGKNPPAAKEA